MMQFVPPKVATVWGQQFDPQAGVEFSRTSFNAPISDEGVNLHEINAQLAALVELSARQAEQQEQTRRQLDDQAQLLSKTIHAVRQLQQQVTSIHNDLKDSVRNHAPNEDEAITITADSGAFAERVKARRGSTVNEKSLRGAYSNRRSSVSDASTTPQRSMSEGSESSSENSPIAGSVVGRTEEELAIPRNPTTTVFNRSPPGLCLYSDEQRDDAWASAVAAEIKNFMISDEEQCLGALQRTSHEVLNKTDDDGMTLLHYAALHGRAEACSAILDNVGFHASKLGDRSNNTAMHIAALHDQAEVCQAILIHDSTTALVPNRYGDTPYDIAQRRGNAAVCVAFEKVQ